MSQKLIATTLLAVVLAGLGVASTAAAGPTKPPSSPGACNMLHASDNGLDGMMNDPHVFDIMIPLVEASLDGGCPHHP
jgi:hypothetical protein